MLDPITGLAIPLAHALQMGFINKEKTTYYNPALDERVSIPKAIKRVWINHTPRELERSPTRLPDGSVAFRYENEAHKTRVRIDWLNGVIRDSTTDAEISIDEALRKGLIDLETAEILAKKSGIQLSRQSILDAQNGGQVQSMEMDENADTITFTIQTTQLIQPKITTITVQDSTDNAVQAASTSEGGLFSFKNAVKLGIFQMNRNRFMDPTSGDTMTFTEALERGFFDASAPALFDITSGRSYTLRDALEIGLINGRDGSLNVEKCERLRLTLDPRFTGRETKLSPLNFEDAILCGLMDTDTGERTDAYM